MALPLGRPLGPWFRRRPRLAMVASFALVAGITVLRFATGDERDAITLLFVLPIALLALAFGLRAGLASAGACLAILVVWVGASEAELTAFGWSARVVPLVLLGGLIGHASDEQRAADRIARRLAVAEVRQRDAAEINDTLVQTLAAAKWMFERGAIDDGIRTVEEAIRSGEALVSDLLDGLEGARTAEAVQHLSNGSREARAPVASSR